MIGVVWLELSTGEFFGTEAWPADLPSLFAKFPPRDLLIPAGYEESAASLQGWTYRTPALTVRGQVEFDRETASTVLKTHLGAERIDAFGFYEGELVWRKRERTHIQSLKVGSNKIFGYYAVSAEG